MMAIVPADIVPFDAAVVAVDVKTETKQTSFVKGMFILNIPKNKFNGNLFYIHCVIVSDQRLLDRIETCAQSDSKKCSLQVCLCANSLESLIYGFYFTCGNVSKNGEIFCSRPLIRCKDKIKICCLIGGPIAKYVIF